MGLFFKKGYCFMCNKEGKKKIHDGFICKECLQMCSIKFQVHVNDKTTKEEILSEIEINKKNKNLLSIFVATKKIGNYIEFDENNKLWLTRNTSLADKINPKVYNFNDILEYELLQDDESVIKGGLGNALVGGALFGSVGAVVGGVTGKKKSKTIINNLKIKITINNMEDPNIYMVLIGTKTNSNSIIYKSAYNIAQDILSMLAIITQKNNEENISTTSTADELLKLKVLLDDGLLTQEEFATEKNKILNRKV